MELLVVVASVGHQWWLLVVISVEVEVVSEVSVVVASLGQWEVAAVVVGHLVVVVVFQQGGISPPVVFS